MISSLLALLANLLLLWLIISIKTLTLKRLRYVLLPCCIIDILLSGITFALEPQVVNIGINVYVMVGSPLNVLGFETAAVLVITYVSIVVTYMNSVCIPFYLRYCVICKNITLTAYHIILPYSFLFLIFLILLIGLLFIMPPIAEDDMYFREPTFITFWLEEYPNGPVFIASKHNGWFFIQFIFILTTVTLSYSLVIYYSIKIKKTLKVHVHAFPETKLLNKQVQKTLTIQAVAPILVANGPIISIMGMTVMKIESLVIPLIMCFPLGWISLVNPLAAMLIIAPYRQKLKNIVCFLKKKPNIINVNLTTSS